jgi:hypothetical protein
VVPPRSDRVSRAPPYSRTPAHPYPYRAVTVCGAPFQTLPVRKQRPLAWSAFARRYLRSRCCCPFLRLLRCFSSPGSPPMAMDSPWATACAVGCPIRRSEDQRALAPPLGFSQRATSFIASRYQGIHQMPFMCRARAQPQAHGFAVCREQRTDDRGQTRPRGTTTHGSPQAPFCSPFSVTCSLEPVREHRPAAARAAALTLCRCSRIGSAYPCPGPTSSWGSPPPMMAGPASRSRLASRCHKIKRPASGSTRGTDARGQMSDGERAPHGPPRLLDIRLRHLFSNAIPMTMAARG